MDLLGKKSVFCPYFCLKMDKMEVKLLLGCPTANLRIQWLRVRPAPGALYMFDPQAELQLIRILTERLERISADSVWAHRASGVRGALLRTLDQLQSGEPPDPKTLTNVVSIAFNILSHAAKRG